MYLSRYLQIEIGLQKGEVFGAATQISVGDVAISVGHHAGISTNCK